MPEKKRPAQLAGGHYLEKKRIKIALVHPKLLMAWSYSLGHGEYHLACKRQHCSKCPSDCWCIYLFIFIFFLTWLLHTCLTQVLLLPSDSCFSCSSLTWALLFSNHFALSPSHGKDERHSFLPCGLSTFPALASHQGFSLVPSVSVNLCSLCFALLSAKTQTWYFHSRAWIASLTFWVEEGSLLKRIREHFVQRAGFIIQYYPGAHSDSQQECSIENLPDTRALEDWNIFFRRLWELSTQPFFSDCRGNECVKAEFSSAQLPLGSKAFRKVPDPVWVPGLQMHISKSLNF